MAAPIPSVNRNKNESENKKVAGILDPLDPTSGHMGPRLGVTGDNSGGGVWANSSAKKDKLLELRAEVPYLHVPPAGHPEEASVEWRRVLSLEDMASDSERLELDITDGVRALTRHVERADERAAFSREECAFLVGEVVGDSSDSGDSGDSSDSGGSGDSIRYSVEKDYKLYCEGVVSRLDDVIARVRRRMDGLESFKAVNEGGELLTPEQKEVVAKRVEGLYILRLIDYVYDDEKKKKPLNNNQEDDVCDDRVKEAYGELNVEDPKSGCYDYLKVGRAGKADADMNFGDMNYGDMNYKAVGSDIFNNLALLYRLTHAKNTAEILLESWAKLTEEVDADVDRRALNGIAKTDFVVKRKDVAGVIEAVMLGNPLQQQRALWTLFDKDDDGLLEEPEMEQVVYTHIDPSTKTVSAFIEECLMRVEEDKAAKVGGKRYKKKLMKVLNTTRKQHAELELETPHRIRCIYAWAEKTHQDGQLLTVHVNEDVTGRRRYVELFPKISFDEYREVVEYQYMQLDTFSSDFVKSFKEDLLVKQGKGRQDTELFWQCMAFFGVVSLLDYGTYLV
jgi:hypothetical protein